MHVRVGQLTNHVDELGEASQEYARVVHFFPVHDDCSTMRRGDRVQTVTRGLDSYFVDQVPLGALATADTHERVAAHTCARFSLHTYILSTVLVNYTIPRCLCHNARRALAQY